MNDKTFAKLKQQSHIFIHVLEWLKFFKYDSINYWQKYEAT